MNDLWSWAAELTEPRRHRERTSSTAKTGRRRGNHETSVPSLVSQLNHAGRPRTGDSAAKGYGSRPVANIEALDTLALIETEANAWLAGLGLEGLGGGLAVKLKRLAEAAVGQPACTRPSRSCCERHRLEADFRRWWVQARIITGWDSPAWRPHNTCPSCGHRGGLRVRLAQGQRAGLCIECRQTWTEDTIDQLAEHIRLENGDE